MNVHGFLRPSLLGQMPEGSVATPQRSAERLSRFRSLYQTAADFGWRAALLGALYRGLKRASGLQLGAIYQLRAADLESSTVASEGCQFRLLEPAEIVSWSADPQNDLNAAWAKHLQAGRTFCLGAFRGDRLVSYAWLAEGPVDPQHSLGVRLALPRDALYLYKAYTHPAERGKRLYQATARQALALFGSAGIEQIVAIVEYANWASRRSHDRLPGRWLGQVARVGRKQFCPQMRAACADF
ncbi:MAG TPA: hypothetical protein VFE24_09955 [Pirellulales bacterium]|jgi:hypothetical protein|nr:hypothetical protein [Pirellulales bacterium]